MIRLLIAEDEEIECRSLEMMIQNSFQTIELLPSVYNGIDLVKSVERYRPELLIADINMPGLNGLEAMEVLRMKSLDTKVIINTAYSDFDFIRQALLLGASDFLVKPVDEEQLESSITRVLGAMRQEKRTVQNAEQTKKQMQDMQRALGEELLSSILLGKTNVKGYRVWLENIGRAFQGGILTAVCMENTVKQDLSLEEIGKYAAEHMQRFCTLQYKVYKGNLYLLLLPGGQVGAHNYRAWTEKFLELLQKKVEEVYGGRILCGVSGWKYELELMTEALGECRAALKSAQEEYIHFFVQEKTDSAYEDIPEMTEAMRDKDTVQCRAVMEHRMERWAAEGYSQWQKMIRMILFVRACAEQLSVGNRITLSWKRMMDRLKEKNEEELIGEMLAVIQEISAHTGQEENKNAYVEEAVRYMEKNYTKDISLGEISQKLGISSFYLSRLLTQELDRSFVELLTDIRMDHAIDLIRNEDTIAKDIGMRVGYLSPNYFHKLFKKNTGMTVSEMRRLIRRQE